MLRDQILLTCMLSVALAGHGQAAPEPAPVAKLPSFSTIPPPVTFHSDLLDLSFAYPNSMVAQTLPSLKEQHDAIAAREPGDVKPESRKMDECSDRALDATRTDDPAKVRDAGTKQENKGGASAP